VVFHLTVSNVAIMSVPKFNPPFRAEHLGSLLRPDYLLEARKKFDKEEITREQLKELEDKAIKDAVIMQKELGLKGLSDGEYRYGHCVAGLSGQKLTFGRRHMFYDGFFDHLEGFVGKCSP
jgi:hypothetical protein